MNKENFEKVFQPKTFESRIYALWLKHGVFSPEGNPERDSEKKPFVMVMPPPNVTGILHMGHGLNTSLQDVLARYHRMCGRPTLWIPGTDHAGIATQHIVEQELKKQGLHRHDIGREKFLEKVWQTKNTHHDIILDQLQQIGCSCDWSRERFTLDEGLSVAVRHAFVHLYNKDLLYRGEYLVNWCINCGTALSDDEVEYEDKQGFLYHLVYHVKNESESLIIATTRPETIFGDAAVAVHPEDPRYTKFIGKELCVPLQDRNIPIIADPYVDREFGTACLKITPAHDINDYEIAKRHQLPCVSILNTQGNFNDHVPHPWTGMNIRLARKSVVNALEEQGLLLKKEAHSHRIGMCYRCHNPVEPSMSTQWFVSMAPLADKALQAWEKGDVKFYPERWGNTYRSWMENIRDWCISRQLWWGHRIPAWHCQECQKISVSIDTVQQCQHCNSSNVIQDPDVLDTWFSSWLWPFSTLGWPEKTPDLEKFYPTNTLVTAYDIIFFWVARMIMAGLEFTGQVPFSDIYITPLVRDKKGKKMSKSLGNGIDPLEIVDKYGADALKFTITYLSNQGQDLPLDKETFKLGSKFCNKIWNASRYLLTNLESINIIDDPDPIKTDIDKWIFMKLGLAADKVAKAIEKYRFDDMGHAIYEYFWNDFCDWYIEALKLPLSSSDPAEQSRALSIALQVLERSLALLHPCVPFLTEEIYRKLPNRRGERDLLAFHPYPTYQENQYDSDLLENFKALQILIFDIRAQSSNSKTPSKQLEIQIICDDNYLYKDFFTKQKDLIEHILQPMSVSVKHSTELRNLSHIPGCRFKVLTPIKILTKDEEIQIEKDLEKKIAKAKEKLKRCETKLSNSNFHNKAADEIVTKEKQKHLYLTQEIQDMEACKEDNKQLNLRRLGVKNLQETLGQGVTIKAYTGEPLVFNTRKQDAPEIVEKEEK